MQESRQHVLLLARRAQALEERMLRRMPHHPVRPGNEELGRYRPELLDQILDKAWPLHRLDSTVRAILRDFKGRAAVVSSFGAESAVLLGLAAIALPIVGTIKALDGNYYRYPVVGVELGRHQQDRGRDHEPADELDDLVEVLRALRDEHEYQQLMEIAGVDYPSREERFEVAYHIGYMGSVMQRLGLSRQKARPSHPKKDPAAEAAFKKRAA